MVVVVVVVALVVEEEEQGEQEVDWEEEVDGEAGEWVYIYLPWISKSGVRKSV